MKSNKWTSTNSRDLLSRFDAPPSRMATGNRAKNKPATKDMLFFGLFHRIAALPNPSHLRRGCCTYETLEGCRVKIKPVMEKDTSVYAGQLLWLGAKPKRPQPKMPYMLVADQSVWELLKQVRDTALLDGGVPLIVLVEDGNTLHWVVTYAHPHLVTQHFLYGGASYTAYSGRRSTILSYDDYEFDVQLKDSPVLCSVFKSRVPRVYGYLGKSGKAWYSYEDTKL